MANNVEVLTGFELNASRPLDPQLHKTKAEMLSDSYGYDGKFCVCSEDLAFYIYNSNYNATYTGHYKKVEAEVFKKASEFETASASNVDEIYICSESSGTFKAGIIYQCQADTTTSPTTYNWVALTEALSAFRKGSDFEIASSSNVGETYICTETNDDFRAGYIYQCQEITTTTPHTYAWKPINQASTTFKKASEFATPSEENVNETYICSEGGGNFKLGTIYQCQKITTTTPATYAWTPISQSTNAFKKGSDFQVAGESNLGESYICSEDGGDFKAGVIYQCKEDISTTPHTYYWDAIGGGTDYLRLDGTNKMSGNIISVADIFTFYNKNEIGLEVNGHNTTLLADGTSGQHSLQLNGATGKCYLDTIPIIKADGSEPFTDNINVENTSGEWKAGYVDLGDCFEITENGLALTVNKTSETVGHRFLLDRDGALTIDGDPVSNKPQFVCSTETSESPNSFTSYITPYSNRCTIDYGCIIKQGNVYTLSCKFKFTTTKPTWSANTEWLNLFNVSSSFKLINTSGFAGSYIDPTSGNYGGQVMRASTSGTIGIWCFKQLTTSGLTDTQFSFNATWVEPPETT